MKSVIKNNRNEFYSDQEEKAVCCREVPFPGCVPQLSGDFCVLSGKPEGGGGLRSRVLLALFLFITSLADLKTI